MRAGLRILGSVLLCGVAAGTIAVTLSAQSGRDRGPRTPWGDPDLQGNYTNLSEAGTPMERPKEFEGRNMNDVGAEERARIKKEAAERTIGRFLGPEHAPDNWWQPAYGSFAERGAQLWFVLDPADGKIPALTPAARARQAAREEARRRNTRGPADSWTDRSLYDRCITRGFPASGMPTIYGNAYQIVQAPGYVAIVYEMIHETRVIPLDGRPHVSGGTQLDMGDARGRWEGDTLVVETTNFRERSVYQNATPDRLTITERFTRIGPTQVRWAVTIDDPTTWMKPWTFAMPLTQDDSEPMQLYECHEGNYGLKNILSAARAEERAGSK
ncbi:MAG TPA: hypothetical protein VFD69_08155 [Vicinamibacterales bacterium]|nr:hypothetical protein [Vicinamibacterales bacterium]